MRSCYYSLTAWSLLKLERESMSPLQAECVSEKWVNKHSRSSEWTWSVCIASWGAAEDPGGCERSAFSLRNHKQVELLSRNTGGKGSTVFSELTLCLTHTVFTLHLQGGHRNVGCARASLKSLQTEKQKLNRFKTNTLRVGGWAAKRGGMF